MSSVTTVWLVRDEFALVLELWVLGLVAVDTVLDLTTEGSDQTLHWPGGGVTKSTDGVTFNLVGELLKHINLSEIGVSEFHALKHVDHPASALTAWSALTAGLVLVELGQTENGVNDISLVVHDNDGGSTETRTSVLEIIEVHDGLLALLLDQHWDGGTAWNDGLEVVPATNNSTAVPVNQLSEWNTHLFLDGNWVVDVTRNAEKLGSGVLWSTEAGKPGCTTTHDSRAHGYGLHIGDGGWATIETGVGWEWWL